MESKMYKVDVQKVYDIINNIRKEISDFAENDDLLMSIYNSFDDYMDFDIVEFNYIKKALQVSNDEILYGSEDIKDSGDTLYEVDVKKVCDIIDSIKYEIPNFAENDTLLMNIYNSYNNFVEVTETELECISLSLQVSSDKILYDESSYNNNNNVDEKLYKVDVNRIKRFADEIKQDIPNFVDNDKTLYEVYNSLKTYTEIGDKELKHLSNYLQIPVEDILYDEMNSNNKVKEVEPVEKKVSYNNVPNNVSNNVSNSVSGSDDFKLDSRLCRERLKELKSKDCVITMTSKDLASIIDSNVDSFKSDNYKNIASQLLCSPRRIESCTDGDDVFLLDTVKYQHKVYLLGKALIDVLKDSYINPKFLERIENNDFISLKRRNAKILSDSVNCSLEEIKYLGTDDNNMF
ncbi:hypothetical protein KQI30_11225 [Clostridium bornimense]|uniref:hypothetical protein n=1 Tax=Clostridium bornimense TaxID=1216932 RepID=UPI001C119BD4|nr:hypothetical protein [Clostridium bornimense]MBU5316837.1 hypothetical protein [Clostridium bornimense]